MRLSSPCRRRARIAPPWVSERFFSARRAYLVGALVDLRRQKALAQLRRQHLALDRALLPQAHQLIDPPSHAVDFDPAYAPPD
jgi:hypothetical protein